MIQRIPTILLAAVLGLGLTSCYRIPVEQGNALKEMNLSAVRPGMSRSQVVAILGQPILENIYVSHQLVYVYSMNTARNRFSIERFFVYFQNGRVTHTETR